MSFYRSNYYKISGVIILAAIIFSSCVGPKKIDRWVDDHYGVNTPARATKKTDEVSVATPLLSIDGNSRTEKKVQNVLPLLFYWRWDYTNTTFLDPELPMKNFTAAVQAHASSKAVKQKLNGQKLELRVDSIPNIFIVNNRTNMIWVVYAISWDKITISPAPGNLVVSYRLLKDNEEIKTGTVMVENTIQVVQKGYFQRLKNLTGDFLFQYDEGVKNMSKKAMDKIVSSL